MCYNGHIDKIKYTRGIKMENNNVVDFFVNGEKLARDMKANFASVDTEIDKVDQIVEDGIYIHRLLDKDGNLIDVFTYDTQDYLELD